MNGNEAGKNIQNKKRTEKKKKQFKCVTNLEKKVQNFYLGSRSVTEEKGGRK